MKIKIIFIMLFALCLSDICSYSYADTYIYDYKTKCDAKSDSVTIIPFATWGMLETGGTYKIVNTKLKNGQNIRVKMKIPFTNESGLMSIWIDKVKVISNLDINCTPELGSSKEIVINSEGYKIYDFDVFDVVDTRKKLGSKIVRKKDYPTRIDYLEYPIKGKFPPKAGSVQVLFGGKKSICNELLKWVAKDFVTVPEKYEPKMVGIAESFNKYKIDINNDGVIEDVLTYRSYSHVFTQDTYYIYEAGESPNFPSYNEVIAEKLYQTAVGIYPNMWIAGSTSSNLHTCEFTFKQKVDAWWDPTNNPHFDLGYLLLDLITCEGETYFLLHSAQVALSHWYAILKPTKTGVVEECIIQKVQPHY